MSPEQARQRAREIVGGCACHVGYKRRDKIDPDCPWHRYGEDITTALLAVRGEALEEAARVIDQGQETHSNIAEGVFLTPRKKDNRAGLGYAAAIRALARSAEPNPPATP